VATECVVCGTEAAVSDACPHCGAACCPDHRPPAAHDCPGTDAGQTTGWRLDLDGVSVGESGGASTAGAPADEPLTSLFRPGFGLALVTLLLVGVALGAVAFGGSLGDGLDASAVETHVEDLSDAEREAASVGTTTHDADLAAVARAHSRDMRARDYVNHTNPDGQDPQDRAAAAGIECRVGENIYQTPRGSLADSERALADHVVRSWLDSPGHRRTLLVEGYTRQGVGVAVGDDGVYVTQLFC
jgi:hypothetical protein